MKKRLIIVSLVCAFVIGCAGQSAIDKAFNTINAISEARNSLQPIYDAVVKVHPELAPEIEAFDHDFHMAIDTALQAVAAWKAGTGSQKQYDVAIQAIINVLNQYHVEDKAPELIPVLTLVKTLLGVVNVKTAHLVVLPTYCS